MQKSDLIKLYSKKRVLVVDEFPDMRASIRRMLRSFGVESVDVANDGGDAMARCRENQYDIIICIHIIYLNQQSLYLLYIKSFIVNEVVIYSFEYMVEPASAISHARIRVQWIEIVFWITLSFFSFFNLLEQLLVVIETLFFA